MISRRRHPKSQSETSLQMQCAGLLDKYLAPPALYTAFPAGGGGFERGTRLKSMGLKAGFPDLMIMWGGGKPNWKMPTNWYVDVWAHHPGSGLYLVELKTENGVISAAQKKMHAAIKLTLPGAEIAICRSLEEFQAKLDEWNLPKLQQSEKQKVFSDAVTKYIDPDLGI